MSAKDQEVAFFYRLSRELIEDRRKNLIQKQIYQNIDGNRQAHEMKCPKCGGKLNDFDFDGLMIDQCENCNGVFFAANEFATLVKREKFVAGVSRFIRFLTTPSASENPMF